MPVTTAAKKALRQNKRKRERNLIYKKRIKDLVKKVQNLIKENKKEEAKNLLPKLYKAVDKTAKRGIIKKNTASRKKSGIAKMINRD
jgi:small subunit ribosomal protein S20